MDRADDESRHSYTPLLLDGAASDDAHEEEEQALPPCVEPAVAVSPTEAPTLSRTLLSLTLPLYAPMLLLFIAWGLVTPVLPLFALSLGASERGVGVVSSARAFGSVLSILPSGVVIARGGARTAVLSGAAVYTLACLWGAAAESLFDIGASRVLAGMGYSLYSCAQQVYVRQVCPPQFRGRVLASVGGTYRVGGLIAPLFGGVMAQRLGFRAVFIVQTCISALALPFIALKMQDRKSAAVDRRATTAGQEPSTACEAMEERTLRAFFRQRWREIGNAWTATILMSMLRSVRDLIIPLAAARAGFSRSTVGFVTASSYAGDTLLFPVGGWLMDKQGCWAAGAAASTIMAAGMLLLSTPDLSAGQIWATAIATGTGNGLSSGIVMALASNIAPEDHRAGPIIASYNFIAALGGVIGPVIVGAVAGSHGLDGGAALSTAFAVMSALWWGLLLPKKVPSKAELPRTVSESELQQRRVDGDDQL